VACVDVLVSDSIKIDIWSDIGCPWCWIGKHKFEDGLAQYRAKDSSVPVEIEYHSFELHPDTPVDFVGTELDWLVSSRGMPASQIRGMMRNAAAIAEAAGTVYDYDNLKHINSIKAHQLVHYAKARGTQHETLNHVLKAYFLQLRGVEDVQDLADLGAEMGFDRDDVVRSLEADEYLGEVQADLAQARSLGIHAVPFFIVDGKYGLSGAQDSSTFADLLQKLSDERVEVTR